MKIFNWRWATRFATAALTALMLLLSQAVIADSELKMFVIAIDGDAGAILTESQITASKVDAKILPEGLHGVSLPLEELTAISKGSQAIVEQLGDSLEWDHSHLTKQGTFCVYCADDAANILKHAEITGIPANPITEVDHFIHDFDFSQAST